MSDLWGAFEAIAACPECHSRLHLIEDDGARILVCAGCGRRYPEIDGIWRFLTPELERTFHGFLAGYHTIRAGDGWERTDDDYYLALPDVPPGDPQAGVWRIRRRSFNYLMKLLGTQEHDNLDGHRRWVLDLGAGNCWLSSHLARLGYNVLSLDINVEGRDSLAGGSVFIERRGTHFVRGQTGMDHLPVQDGRIAEVVINGAFHYVDAALTLRAIRRALKPGGRVIIMDSPVYTEAASGQQMMREQRERFRTQYGVNAADTPGAGFLVLSETVRLLESEGFRATVKWLDNRGAALIRKVLPGHKRLNREEARFPVLTGIKDKEG